MLQLTVPHGLWEVCPCEHKASVGRNESEAFSGVQGSDGRCSKYP